jgi:hypothetical protein
MIYLIKLDVHLLIDSFVSLSFSSIENNCSKNADILLYSMLSNDIYIPCIVPSDEV